MSSSSVEPDNSMPLAAGQPLASCEHSGQVDAAIRRAAEVVGGCAAQDQNGWSCGCDVCLKGPERVLREHVGPVFAAQAKEVERLERELAEARKDTARLDWLERQATFGDWTAVRLGLIPLTITGANKAALSAHDTLREAIDTARENGGSTNADCPQPASGQRPASGDNV